MQQLLEIIRVQNETINLLEGAISDTLQTPKLSELFESNRKKDAQIKDLMTQLQQQQQRQDKLKTEFTPTTREKPASTSWFSGGDHKAAAATVVPAATTSSTSTNPTATTYATTKHATQVPPHGLEKECEMKYGMQLVDLWKSHREVWCEDNTPTPESEKSRLICYPYHQEHKKRDGRGADMFCEATNMFVDFSKVHGEAAKGHKPPLGEQYLSFDRGSLFSPTCERTSKYRGQLMMPHHSLQMGSFLHAADGVVSPAAGTYTVEEVPTYLLARDEDCENSFHSTADFMNMFLVMSVLDVDPQRQRVVLFDKHLDGPYLELIQKAFSPSHPVGRHQQFNRKTVLFKRLIFHLESPAGLIFPKVALPGPLRCHSTGLFQEYRKFILQSFNLYDVPPPPVPTVILSLRYRTPHKNVGRVLQNAAEVEQILKEGSMIKVNVIDAAKMTFTEQLTTIRHSNVLVGVHGAGLMFVMFAADEAVLIELHPSYRLDRHFRHAARMTGKIYMPLRATQRETCVGSSDNVVMPLEEFRRTIDGAIRIARSFDSGLAECGLVCSSAVLALDGHLDGLYGSMGMQKGAPINTGFPCG